MGDQKKVPETRKSSNESLKTMYKRSKSPIIELSAKVPSKRSLERPKSKFESNRLVANAHLSF